MNTYEVAHVRMHQDHIQFEREVEGLLEICKLVASCKDTVARDALAFMPEFKANVVREAKRRIGLT